MQTHLSESSANRRRPAVAAAGPGRVRAGHAYTTASVREMTPAETEAQRRLVRASLLAKPA